MTAPTVNDSAVYVGTFEPGSDQWHRARAEGLGGSEVAPVLGLSPFESRFSLWHRKRGLAGPVQESPEMYWGKRLEPVIRDVFREQHPDLDIREVGTWRHRDRPWQVANPDGLGVDCLWEGKYALSDIAWGEPGTDEIPEHYRTQALHYMDVFGITTLYLSVFIGGTADYREYTITYDEAEAAANREACRQFLDEVAANVRPDIDEHTETYQVLRELHPDITPDVVDLDEQLGADYLAANAAFKDAETAKRLQASLVADAMGTAQRARYRGEVIAIRTSKQGGLPFVQAKPVPKTRKDTAA